MEAGALGLYPDEWGAPPFDPTNERVRANLSRSHSRAETVPLTSKKLSKFCENLRELGYKLDMCCIDKTNSTELDEAIRYVQVVW